MAGEPLRRWKSLVVGLTKKSPIGMPAPRAAVSRFPEPLNGPSMSPSTPYAMLLRSVTTASGPPPEVEILMLNCDPPEAPLKATRLSATVDDGSLVDQDAVLVVANDRIADDLVGATLADLNGRAAIVSAENIDDPDVRVSGRDIDAGAVLSAAVVVDLPALDHDAGSGRIGGRSALDGHGLVGPRHDGGARQATQCDIARVAELEAAGAAGLEAHTRVGDDRQVVGGGRRVLRRARRSRDRCRRESRCCHPDRCSSPDSRRPPSECWCASRHPRPRSPTRPTTASQAWPHAADGVMEIENSSAAVARTGDSGRCGDSAARTVMIVTSSTGFEVQN